MSLLLDASRVLGASSLSMGGKTWRIVPADNAIYLPVG